VIKQTAFATAVVNVVLKI